MCIQILFFIRGSQPVSQEISYFFGKQGPLLVNPVQTTHIKMGNIASFI